ncbi:hypothetical protein GOBAR_DD36969 [Gossypium barbadense]|nr:hypothetical protein GOBAR_DD36969 [Gossypium barbadense]
MPLGKASSTSVPKLNGSTPKTPKVRHRLKKDHGIEGGIPVVFSLEKPKAKLLPFRGPSGEEDNPSDYQVRMLAFYFCSFKVLCLIT